MTRASHVFASRVALVAVTEADVAEAVARAAPISFDQTFDSHDADGEDDGVPDAREEGDPGAVSSDAGPLVLLRLLGSPAFESHAALVELALASLLSVLTASKKERERLARDWRCTRLGGHEPGAKPRGERRSDALEPWRLGFDARAGASSFKKKDPSDDGKGKGAAVAAVASEEPDSTKPSGSDSQAPVAPPSAPTLGGLRPLSSAAIRRAVAAAPPSTRALARLVARDALTSGAQTKAFDLVKTLAAAAPGRARRSRRRSPRRRRRAPRTPSPRWPTPARRRRAGTRATPRKPPRWKRGLRVGILGVRSGCYHSGRRKGDTPSRERWRLAARLQRSPPRPPPSLRLARAAAAALAATRRSPGAGGRARAEVFETARVDALRADPKRTEAEANARADATAGGGV